MSAAGSAPAPTTWAEFVAWIEHTWGEVEQFGAAEIGALFGTLQSLLSTFSAEAVSFVSSELEAFVKDLTSGSMTIEQAATAILNSASGQAPTLLKDIENAALEKLIAALIAAL